MGMGITKTKTTSNIIYLRSLFLDFFLILILLLLKTLLLLSTNSFNLKNHLTYFSYQRSCGFADSSYNPHIP